MQKNAFYAQSGGPTAVINTTAHALITTAKQYPERIGTVYAGHNGIIGALNEELIDTFLEAEANIAALRHTPGSAFGSCRYKLKKFEEDPSEYHRLIEVFKAHNIGYFFYNGGGDSQDTAYKISQVCQKMDYPLICIGLPKTIDNDLPFTDCCPGFGSAAKYVATSIMEASLDLAGMARNSTQVFVLEVMGRHAGWLTAAAGLAKQKKDQAPHLLLFPEIPFEETRFLDKVSLCIKQHGHCAIVASEGLKNSHGEFLADSGVIDAFGHHQLGGVAPVITHLIREKLQLKCRWGLPDYLQRSARHCASLTDAEQAFAIGKAAIEFALEGKTNIMLTIERDTTDHYSWHIGEAPLKDVANQEKKMPLSFIADDGFSITNSCRDYLLPLTQGEDYPPYFDGLPDYRRIDGHFVTKKLAALCP